MMKTSWRSGGCGTSSSSVKPDGTCGRGSTGQFAMLTLGFSEESGVTVDLGEMEDSRLLGSLGYK